MYTILVVKVVMSVSDFEICSVPQTGLNNPQ